MVIQHVLSAEEVERQARLRRLLTTASATLVRNPTTIADAADVAGDPRVRRSARRGRGSHAPPGPAYQGGHSCAHETEGGARPVVAAHTVSDVIFKAVGDTRPYPEHGYSTRQWSNVPPRLVRLDDLVTTKRTLDLGMLLSEDSTFYGDLFAHVVEFEGTLYLEDGLHRALRAALHQRPTLHARVLVIE